ncbi:unnamed protein product [Closterium sp. NIES-53]
MYITLYFIVTRLPDSLRSVRDHFLSLDPTSLTIDLLEQHLLASETSAVVVGAARGTPHPPFFEGCSPSPLAPSYASAAAADVSVSEDVRAASPSAKRRNSKGKGGRGGGGGSGGGGGGSGSGGGGSSGGGGGGETVGRSGFSGGGGGGSGESGGSGGGGTGSGGTGARRVGSGGGQRQQQQRWSETPSPQQLREWFLRGASGGSCPYVIRTGASRCFFPDSTTLTRLPALVPVRLADPSGGLVVARSSTVLPCPAVLSGSLSGLHLPSFSTNLVAASCSCRLQSQQTLLCHHRLGHPYLPRLRGMNSRLLVSGLPRSLPPLPPSPAPPCLPCVEGRQRAAPYSSSYPPTTAPLQTLYMEVWGPARVSGQSRERYFLLVVDDYTRYTTVFPLQNKGEVVDVLIPWIRTVRLQLRERFGQDLPVLRLHFDRGGEFSSSLLQDYCRGEGILQSFTLLDSPQQNGIAERRIGLVMEVACTSMIHAATPHFVWPFAVRYVAHQLNLWPRVSLPETSPTLRWTGEVGDASVFRVWGSRALVRDTSADKLSPCAIPCVFLGFVPNAPSWQFYHLTSRRVLPSQDVTFDESVPFYRLFPYRSAPPSPPLLFLAPSPPLVDPLPPQGPAPLGVSQVDPLLGPAPVQVADKSGAARGTEPGVAESEGAETGGAERGGVAIEGAEPWGVGTGAGEPGGTEPKGVEPGGATSEGAESGGAEPQGSASSGGSAGALPRLSPQQLREWFVRCTHLRSGATGAGGAGAGGARASGPGIGGAGVGGPGVGGARAGGAGVVDPGGTVRPRPYFVPLLQQVLGTPPSGALTPPLLCPLPNQSQPLLQPASPLPAPSPYTEQSGGLTERREPASPPPESSLPEVPDLESDRARAASPTVSHLLATAISDPSFESAAASALVAELLDFAATCCLDYASALVAQSVSVSPPSVGGKCALGTDVFEDRQEDFECLAPAVPCFASMLLAPEGDPDSPDIPNSCSYAEAITGTYVDEVPPPGANIVDGMWIFRVKRPLGSPPAFKARYVARGFSQRQGVDYFQTFSPTPKMTTLQVLLHVAAQRDYELHSLDFSTAFLQGSLHEEIWLRRPPCFIETTLAVLGFAPSIADPSLFLRTDTSLPPFYVLVYVDDLVFATADTEALTLVKSELQKRHTCTDLGEQRSYLGLQITRDRARRTIILTQSHMVHQVLQHFGFQFSWPQPTPLSTSHSLSAPPSDESVEMSGPYLELVGCLMYLMTCTRPDLAYPLSLLARYVALGRHGKVHWDAAKRVLRYLCSTSGMGLMLGGRGPIVLTGSADASWVDDSATQHSSQGYTFSLESGSASWRSTRSSSVLSSCCEAEIYAGAMAAQELR